MFNCVDSLLPANRQMVNKYLCDPSMARTEQLLRSVAPYRGTNDTDLREKTQEYVLQEKARIKANLESIKYDIDAPNTLALITGPGRIEKVTNYFLFYVSLTLMFFHSIFSLFYISFFDATGRSFVSLERKL